MGQKEIVPELMVADVNTSIHFYRDHLGFKVEQVAPEEGNPTWAELSLDGIKIMLQRQEEMYLEIPRLESVKPGGTVLIVIRTTGAEVKGIHSTLSAQVDIAMPLRETDYGTVEFCVADRDGYLILFSGRG